MTWSRDVLDSLRFEGLRALSDFELERGFESYVAFALLR